MVKVMQSDYLYAAHADVPGVRFPLGEWVEVTPEQAERLAEAGFRCDSAAQQSPPNPVLELQGLNDIKSLRAFAARHGLKSRDNDIATLKKELLAELGGQ